MSRPLSSPIHCCSSRSPVPLPWPPPAPRRRKRRRGKRPRREPPPRRPCGRPLGQGAGSRGGNPEAQGRGANWRPPRLEPRRRHLGGGTGTGRECQGAGPRQNRGAAAAMGRRQRRSATAARCRHGCARERRRGGDRARCGSRGRPPGGARTPADLGVDQPQDPKALCPAGLQAGSWKVQSRSQIPIVRSARMSSPPPSAPTTTPSCDGTSSR